MYWGIFITVPFNQDSMDAFSHGLFFFGGRIFVVDSVFFLMFFFQTDGAVTNFLLIVTCNIELGLEVISPFFLFQL